MGETVGDDQLAAVCFLPGLIEERNRHLRGSYFSFGHPRAAIRKLKLLRRGASDAARAAAQAASFPPAAGSELLGSCPATGSEAALRLPAA